MTAIRALLAVPLLAVAGAAAADEADPDLRVVEQALLVPEANFTWGDGRLHLHPKGMLQGAMGARRDTGGPWSSDPSWGGVAGIEARWSPIREQRFVGEALGGVFVDSGVPSRDAWRGLARAEWVRLSPTLNLRGEVLARIDREELIYAGISVRLIHEQAGMSAWYEGPRLRIDADPQVLRERYLEDGPLGEGDRRDWTGVTAPLAMRWRAGSSLAWLGRIGLDTYDFTAASNNPDGCVLRATVGAEVKPADGLTCTAVGGIAAWNWHGPYAGIAAWGGEDPILPDAFAEGRWEWYEHGLLVLFGTLGSQIGVSATTVAVQRVGTRAEHAIDDRWRMTAELAYARVLDVDGRFDDGQLRFGTNVVFSADFVHQHGWRLRWFASTDLSRIRHGPSYDRWAVGMQTFLIL